MPSKLLQQAAKTTTPAQARKGKLKKATDRADPADNPAGLIPLPRTAHEGTTQERLAVLEDIIGRAQETAELTVRQAQEHFSREAGPALHLIYEDELWKPEYETFVDYVQRRWGYSSTHGYLLVSTVAVQRALPEGAVANTGHVQVLAPVLRHNGGDAVRECWAQSEKKNGRPTAATLKAAADALSYGKPAEPKLLKGEVEQRKPAAPSAIGQLENGIALVKRHLTRNLVKKALEEDPEAARHLAQDLASWAETVVQPATK